MARGRKAKPVKMHLVDGTYRKDRHGPVDDPKQASLLPGRTRKPSPPKPPKHLKGTARRRFEDTVAALADLGILDECDVGIVVLYAEALAELSWADYKVRREGKIVPTGTGSIKPHPAIAIKNAAALRAGKFAAELGLTPSARARLKLGAGFGVDDPDPEESDLD